MLAGCYHVLNATRQTNYPKRQLIMWSRHPGNRGLSQIEEIVLPARTASHQSWSTGAFDGRSVSYYNNPPRNPLQQATCSTLRDCGKVSSPLSFAPSQLQLGTLLPFMSALQACRSAQLTWPFFHSVSSATIPHSSRLPTDTLDLDPSPGD